MNKIIPVIPLMIAGAGITLIELYALHLGINGVALSASVGSLGAISGFIMKTIIGTGKRKEK